MELVYLWVEDYKNIKKQGFNFSPRFDCKFFDEYDEHNKLKDDCKLDINENEDYLSIFPDNINVTAIVGKNGSGKSSIIELINEFSYDNPLISLYPILHMKLNMLIIYYDSIKNTLFISNKNVNIEIVNQSLITIEKQIDQLPHKILIRATPTHRQKEYFLLLNFLINHKELYFPFDIPEIMHLGIHDDTLDLLELIVNNEFDFYSDYSPFHEDKDKRFKIFHVLLLLAYLKNYKIDFDIKASKNYDKTIKELEKRIDKNVIARINTFIKDLKKNLESFSDNLSHCLKIGNIPCDFFKMYVEIVKRKNGQELLDFKGKNVFTSHIYPKMSDGQYQFLYLFNMIYSSMSTEENILLCIDEGENYLHPNWQKKYLSYLISFFKDNFQNKNIHIILTTHSPFILSDIPKQNAIFLDITKKGNCKVVDGLNEKIQTFGANIHTLLSDGFFMNDGLMGEFAKEKINEVIKYLKNEESEIKTDKEAKNIIDIIGEPILKNTLLTMYDEKKYSKESKLEKLNRKKLELENEIKELEKKSNE